MSHIYQVCCPKSDVTFDVFPKNCGLPQEEAAVASKRILGGTTAPMGENPWIAAFLYLSEFPDDDFYVEHKAC